MKSGFLSSSLFESFSESPRNSSRVFQISSRKPRFLAESKIPYMNYDIERVLQCTFMCRKWFKGISTHSISPRRVPHLDIYPRATCPKHCPPYQMIFMILGGGLCPTQGAISRGRCLLEVVRGNCLWEIPVGMSYNCQKYSSFIQD